MSSDHDTESLITAYDIPTCLALAYSGSLHAPASWKVPLSSGETSAESSTRLRIRADAELHLNAVAGGAGMGGRDGGGGGGGGRKEGRKEGGGGGRRERRGKEGVDRKGRMWHGLVHSRIPDAASSCEIELTIQAAGCGRNAQRPACPLRSAIEAAKASYSFEQWRVDQKVLYMG